nr:restriction endonuclease subunit S [Pseudoalteromonas sp. MMG022]
MFGDPVSNPKGWKPAKMGDLIEFAKDGPHVSPKYSVSGIPFLSTRHVKPSGVVWEDLKYVSQEEADVHWKKCKPQKGDVLYTKGGTTGIACPVDFEKEFAVWVHVALVRPKPKLANHIWLTHMLNTKFCYQQSQRYTRGATNKDLGLKRMVDIEMYAPPIEEQERFVKVRENVLGLLSKFDESSSDSLFNSLSQSAFAGKL